MGYGDYLMLSGRVRSLKSALPGVQVSVAPQMESSGFFKTVFQRNPFYTPCSILNQNNPFLIIDKYLPGGRNPKGNFIWDEDFFAIPGDIYLDDFELLQAKKMLENELLQGGKKLVVLNPYAKRGARSNNQYQLYPHYVNKEWGIGRFAEVARNLGDYAEFVVLSESGSHHMELPKGIRQIKCNSFREAASIAHFSHAYLGVEGGMHHLFAALRKNAVVIFGGWISPVTTGYSFHVNYYVGDISRPCGSAAPCKHCEESMGAISVAEVTLALSRILQCPVPV